MRTVALEPNFGRRNTRALVYGGLAGNLTLQEKGWLGHKETLLHSGEGPIWQVRWRGKLIAWANDAVRSHILILLFAMTEEYLYQGVKIYDHASQSRITFIDKPQDSPRADLFKCTLHWQDDSTLLIAWADLIKVTRIRERPRTTASSATASLPPFIVEITAVFQLDCMIAGIVPHPTPSPNVSSDVLPSTNGLHNVKSSEKHPTLLTSFLIVAYSPPETFTDEMTEDRARQARKLADRPELRIISRAGEELATDAITVMDFQKWGCNDYVLVEGVSSDDPAYIDLETRSYVVLSPKDLVRVMPRDRRDHVAWLLERQRYEEALEEVEKIEVDGLLKKTETTGESENIFSAVEIGQEYIRHLVNEGGLLIVIEVEYISQLYTHR